MKLKLFGTFAIVMATVVSAHADSSDWSDVQRANQAHAADENCNKLRYPFVLNKANVNALVALSCAGLSHVENERKEMTYENGSTLFHQWKTTGDSSQIHVEGFCAIPLPDLEANDFDRHKIDLTFTEQSSDENHRKIKVAGSIAGKSMNLEFSNNHFLDERCSNDDFHISRLQEINLGTGGGIQDLIDMLRSKRTGVGLQLLQTESWLQGQTSTSFRGLGLQYRMAQANGRQIGLAAASTGSGSVLGIRSANILDYYEGGGYYDVKEDSFGQAERFAVGEDQDEAYGQDGLQRRQKAPTNHKFQVASIADGSQIVGCSSLIYNGELDTPVEVDLDNCLNHVQQSGLQKFAEKSQVADERTPEEQAELVRKAKERDMVFAAEQKLALQIAPAKNYSDRPNVFETGKVPWSKEDIKRGYVVFQRNIQVDVNAQKISVVEFRSDVNGNHSKRVYNKKFSELNLGGLN